MPDYSATITNFVAGDDLTVTRTITGVPAGDTLAKAWLTVKRRQRDLDAAAIFQKEITPVDVPGTGEITDTGGDGTGAVRFDLADEDTLLLEPLRGYYYDIQVLTANGFIYTPETGRMTALRGYTDADS